MSGSNIPTARGAVTNRARLPHVARRLGAVLLPLYTESAAAGAAALRARKLEVLVAASAALFNATFPSVHDVPKRRHAPKFIVNAIDVEDHAPLLLVMSLY